MPFKVWAVSDGWNWPTLVSADINCKKIYEYGQKGLGFSMEIKSEDTKAGGGMFVSSNAGLAYNKIYFKIGTNFTPSVDDVLKATQTWEIFGNLVD